MLKHLVSLLVFLVDSHNGSLLVVLAISVLLLTLYSFIVTYKYIRIRSVLKEVRAQLKRMMNLGN